MDDVLALLPDCELAELRHVVAQLRREVLELRQQVGYWRAMHARATERIAVLEAENEQLRAENRKLQSQLFGRKSETTSPDRSNQPTIAPGPAFPPRSNLRALTHCQHGLSECLQGSARMPRPGGYLRLNLMPF